ncbi:hypothetical protein D3C76_1443520 [compost metagenome]|jgi:hypothetical protein
MMLVRVPVEGEQAFGAAAQKFGFTERNMVLAAGVCRPGDITVRHQRRTVGMGAQGGQQAVFPGPGRPHQIDKLCHQNTCLPWRHTFCT